MAVENVVFVAGDFIGQGPDQGLPCHFARLSRPHHSITYMLFSPEEYMMDDITCILAAESLNHITCWGISKGDGRPAGRKTCVEEDLGKSSSHWQALAIFWKSISVFNSSKKLPRVRRCFCSNVW